jgi:hypothetical protein
MASEGCVRYIATMGYVRHIVAFGNVWHIMVTRYLCQIVTMSPFSSHCEDKDTFVTLRRQWYLHHIATICFCSSHYNDGSTFIMLRRKGYVRHIETLPRLSWYYVHDIATLLCFSCCNVQFCLSDYNIGLYSSHKVENYLNNYGWLLLTMIKSMV